MLHEINDPIPTAKQAMDREYRRIMLEAGDDGMTSAKALDIAAGIVNHLIDLGEVEEPDRHMALVSDGKAIDRVHGNRADSILRKMALGEFHLFEDNDLLGTVVTLGEGKRKSWKFVTAEDLREMHDIRHKNMKATVDAYKEFESNYSTVLRVVFEYRTIGAAATAGAFTKAA